MVNYLKALSYKYDTGIKKECDRFRKELEKCLNENYKDEFVCHYTITAFKDCINAFDKTFREKYNINN